MLKFFLSNRFVWAECPLGHLFLGDYGTINIDIHNYLLHFRFLLNESLCKWTNYFDFKVTFVSIVIHHGQKRMNDFATYWRKLKKTKVIQWKQFVLSIRISSLGVCPAQKCHQLLHEMQLIFGEIVCQELSRKESSPGFLHSSKYESWRRRSMMIFRTQEGCCMTW